jgi:hypothetical protein
MDAYLYRVRIQVMPNRSSKIIVTSMCIKLAKLQTHEEEMMKRDACKRQLSA